MATITERAAAAVETLRDETAMQARRAPDDRALARRRVLVATMDAISVGAYPEQLRIEALGYLALAEREHVTLAVDGCDGSSTTDIGHAELEGFRARLCELRGECGQLASVMLRASATVDGALTRADAVAIVDAALAFDPSGECLDSIVAAFRDPSSRARKAA